MPCYLLHTMEDPDRDAYRDPDLKDVVGLMPRFFCAHCQPIRPLVPSEALRCIERPAPCWKPAEKICDEGYAPAGRASDNPLKDPDSPWKEG